MLNLENSYLELPEKFFRKANPARFASPQMVAFNHALAHEIGLETTGLSDHELSQIFSGHQIAESSPPIALVYAGFQFGHPNPQLGDGRAHLLGQSSDFDIQLKGSGPTPFSRGGDGKSALGPVLREYIVSEAMHHLGVPTTRALCALRSGENVIRQDGLEPGGIFTRVAESHIRVGTFQYFSFREDHDSIATLLDYTVGRHYPDLHDLPKSQKAIAALKALTLKQADLVAQWTGLGFIHGVMNTDNFSLAGITIDYGPCAFMEEFSFNKVFSSVDRNGRYAFFNQAAVAKWNILRLAESLLPLIHSEQHRAIAVVEKEVLPEFDLFEKKRTLKLAQKLGLPANTKDSGSLVDQFLTYLQQESLDFTTSFYHLPALLNGDDSHYRKGPALSEFLRRWKPKASNINSLESINPLYIPRNHLIQRAIEEAYTGNDTFFHRLNTVLSQPFKTQKHAEEFSIPAKPHERVYQTFCGT